MGTARYVNVCDTVVIGQVARDLVLAVPQVQDTTGGGDALVAALTAGLARGLDPHDAGKMAVTASARTVDHPGGRPDLQLEEVWPR